MPNLGLSEGDAKNLIGYLEAVSRRIANAKPSGGSDTANTATSTRSGGG